MNESSFIQAIHRRLPEDIHRWKINARFANGVPDAWYSGNRGDLWVEYKYLSEPPKRPFTPRVSPLQLRWLDQRYKEGRNVALIVGFPEGGVIVQGPALHEKVSPKENYYNTDGIAKWIAMQVSDSN